MPEDRISGTEFSRAGLDQALAALHDGGVLVVWKLDRLGRSMLDTVKIVVDLDKRGVGFRSLTESFDTKTPMGRGVLALLAAVAEDEGERLRERTKAGMEAARRRGKHVGRPSIMTPEKINMARRLLAEGNGRGIVARMIGVGPATLRRALNVKVPPVLDLPPKGSKVQHVARSAALEPERMTALVILPYLLLRHQSHKGHGGE